MEHLGLPAKVSIEHVTRQFQRQTHRVAIVVVRDVVAPVHELRPVLTGMRQVPVVNIDHAIAAVDFDHWRDQRNHAVADRSDVRTLVNGEPVGKFHQSRRRAGFGRVNRARNVIDGKGLIDEAIGFGIVEIDRARVGEFR